VKTNFMGPSDGLEDSRTTEGTWVIFVFRESQLTNITNCDINIAICNNNET
jgi:hypothetical protein